VTVFFGWYRCKPVFMASLWVALGQLFRYFKQIKASLAQ
jgi:hypothetical protein